MTTPIDGEFTTCTLTRCNFIFAFNSGHKSCDLLRMIEAMCDDSSINPFAVENYVTAKTRPLPSNKPLYKPWQRIKGNMRREHQVPKEELIYLTNT